MQTHRINSKLSRRCATIVAVGFATLAAGLTSQLCNTALAQGDGNPIRASVIHKQALGYLQAGRLNEGILLLNRAAKEDGSDSAIYYNLGVAYTKTNQHQKAWQALRRCVTLDPSRSDAWIALAEAYNNCGDKKQATFILMDIPRRFPTNLFAQKDANTVLSRIASGSQIGITSAANVVRSDPTSLDAWIELAHTYSLQKKDAEALVTLEKARSRFSGDKRYHCELALALKNMKKYKEAAAEFMEAAKLDTTDPKLLDYAIWCQVQCADFDGIQATRKLFIQRFPTLKESKEMADALKYYESDFANTKKTEAMKRASERRRCFNASDMPLKVFVHNRLKGRTVWDAKNPKSGDINYSLLIERAMQEWSNASGKEITFMFSNRSDDANIECTWTSDRSQLDMTFAAGVTSGTRNSKGQYKANIKLLAKAPGFDLTESEFYQACLHELGHALGLSHSSSPSDIMYFSNSLAQGNKNLSTNDIARLKSLYSDLKSGNTTVEDGDI